MNTVTCYQCGDEVLDRDSVNADHITKDGGSFCHKCYEEMGECDTCGGGYDLASRWNRCGDCGDCGKCCQHAKEWEAVNV